MRTRNASPKNISKPQQHNNDYLWCHSGWTCTGKQRHASTLRADVRSKRIKCMPYNISYLLNNVIILWLLRWRFVLVHRWPGERRAGVCHGGWSGAGHHHYKKERAGSRSSQLSGPFWPMGIIIVQISLCSRLMTTQKNVFIYMHLLGSNHPNHSA